MSKHDQFEEWCALAATGQLSPKEQEQLGAHLTVCAPCRDAYSEFAQILNELPPLEDIEVDQELIRQLEESGFRERFLDRATAAGYRFSAEARGIVEPSSPGGAPGRFRLRYTWAASIATTAIVSSAVTYGIIRSSANGGYDLAHVPAVELQQPAQSTSSTAQTPSSALDHEVLTRRIAELLKSFDHATKELSGHRADNEKLVARLNEVEHERGANQATTDELQTMVVRSRDTNAALAAKLEQTAQSLRKAEAEVEASRSGSAVAETRLTVATDEISRLSDQLRLERVSLDHDRQLLSAGRDITDLMGARNLHIIDVHDADSKGKDRKAFGRVFYTEGKSLIFYAFDLDEKRLANAKYSFEAWGERIGQPASAKSLGVLYSDDREQKRWALRVDDPRELAEIDSVFVTLEPSEGSRQKPRGRRVLYAFLGGQANHP
jgi:hypothetical protein